MPNPCRFALAILTGLGAALPAAAQEAIDSRDPVGDVLAAAAREEAEGRDPAATATPPPEPPVMRQASDSRDPVGDADLMLRESYDPIGLRAGSFIVFPSIETATVYTSNVHQSPTDKASDVGAVVAPELRIESDWSRHSLRITATSSHVRYDGNPEEDVDTVNVNAALRLDATSRTALNLDGSIDVGKEERDSLEVPQGAETSPEIVTLNAGAGLTHRFNRLSATLRGELGIVEYGNTDLGNGASIDNGDRDYAEGRVSLRLGYEVSPVLQPFVEGAYSVREHDQRLDRNGLRRDSEGVSIAGGIAVNAGPILRGEVSVGYERRDFDDPALDPAEGPTVNAGLTWAPTRLTTVALTGSTTVAETTVAGASAAIAYSAGTEVSHSLSYNLTASIAGSYGRTDYTGTTLAEENVDAQANLEYRLNPTVVLKGGYSYSWYASTAPGSEYDAHSVRMGVKLQK